MQIEGGPAATTVSSKPARVRTVPGNVYTPSQETLSQNLSVQILVHTTTMYKNVIFNLEKNVCVYKRTISVKNNLTVVTANSYCIGFRKTFG